MAFCQFVIGPPGAGKSTYCESMCEFMKAIGRDAAIVNLDPANEIVKYDCQVNITDLITVEDAMAEHSLGPNGALIFCMDWLSKNMHLLKELLKPHEEKYLLFDFPGQAELYTHHTSMRDIVEQFKEWDYRPVALHMVDSFLCADPSHFVSALVMSLSVMCHLELPHINVLSKVDLFEKMGKTAFPLEYYAEVTDLDFLLQHVDPLLGDDDDEDEDEDGSDKDKDTDERDGCQDDNVCDSKNDEEKHGDNHKHVINHKNNNKNHEKHLRLSPEAEEARKGLRRLSSAICELVTDYSLVGFQQLSVNDKYAMHALLTIIDKANGYIFATEDLKNVDPRMFVMKTQQEPPIDPYTYGKSGQGGNENENKIVERSHVKQRAGTSSTGSTNDNSQIDNTSTITTTTTTNDTNQINNTSTTTNSNTTANNNNKDRIGVANPTKQSNTGSVVVRKDEKG